MLVPLDSGALDSRRLLLLSSCRFLYHMNMVLLLSRVQAITAFVYPVSPTFPFHTIHASALVGCGSPRVFLTSPYGGIIVGVVTCPSNNPYHYLLLPRL